MQVVGALAQPGECERHLLQVVRHEEASSQSGAHDAEEDLRVEAERYLRGVTGRHKQESHTGAPLQITWSVVFDPDVAAAILDEVALVDQQTARSRYAAIALSSHGRSGV